MARLRALGLSVVLHAGLVLLLLKVVPTTPELLAPPASTPLEVELIAVPAAAAPEPSPAPELAPAPAPTPTPRERPRPPSEPPAGEPPAAAPEPDPMPPAPPPPDRRPPPGGLRPSFDTIDRLTRDGIIAPPDPTLAPPSEPARGSAFSQRLAERVQNDAARKNVSAGKVHPQLYDFLRDARRGFTPRAVALDRDPRAPNTVGRSFKQWGRGMAQAGKSWGRSLGDERRKRLDHDPDRRGAPDILEHYNRLIDGTARAVEPMDCMVCLVIRPEAPPEVVLSGSSGNAEVDRAAIEALRRSANTRPLDKDVRPQKTCYRFRASVHRIPPIPLVGCGFDESTLTASCYYPTMKVRRTSVTLESVEYDGG